MVQNWTEHGAGEQLVNGGLWCTCLWMVAPSTDLEEKHFNSLVSLQ